jgi:AcrR family transcriptional regulator
MSPPVGEPQQERARETRLKILETASVAFAQGGYERTSLSELLRRCQVSKGAFYFHFRSKEDLALATYRFKLEQLIDQTYEEVGAQPDGLTQLVTTIRVSVRRLHDDPSLRVVVRLGSDLAGGAGPDSEFTHHQELSIEGFRQVIQRGLDDGSIRPGIDARKTAEDVLALLVGADRVSGFLTGGADGISRAEHYLDLLLFGLAGPGPGGSPDEARMKEVIQRHSDHADR